MCLQGWACVRVRYHRGRCRPSWRWALSMQAYRYYASTLCTLYAREQLPVWAAPLFGPGDEQAYGAGLVVRSRASTSAYTGSAEGGLRTRS